MSASFPALLLSFVPGAEAAPPAIPTAEQYRIGEWSYCDVHLLARAWGQTEDEARRTIATKVSGGGSDLVRQARDEARGLANPTGWDVCPYWEAGFDYNDADALSRAWGRPIEEIKAYIENKLVWKMDETLSDSLMQARVFTPSDPSLAMTIPAPYNACDVQLLGAHKQVPSTETIRRMQAAPAGTTKKAVDAARKAKGADTALCGFWTLGYSYEDAERLAAAWGIEVMDAKARVGTMARKGQLGQVDVLLGR